MKKKFLAVAVFLSMILTLLPQNYVFAISGTKGDSTPVIDGETLLFAEGFDGKTTSELMSEYDAGINSGKVGTDNGIYFTGQNSSYVYNWDLAFNGNSTGGSIATMTNKFDESKTRYFAFQTAQADVVSSGLAHIYFGFMRRNSYSNQDVYVFGYSSDSYDFINQGVKVIPTATVNSWANSTWFMIDLIIDLDNDKCYVAVKNYDTGVVVYSDIVEYTKSNVRGACLFLKQKSGSSSSLDWSWKSPKVDDLYIGKLNSALSDNITVPSGETSIYTTNFETLSDGSAWYDDDALTDGGFRSWNGSGIVPGCRYLFEDARSVKAFSPTYDSGESLRTFEYYLPYSNKADAGSGRFFHIGFCYKPGTYATTNQIKLYPYKSGADKLIYSSKAVEVLSTTDASSIGNKWVYIDLVIDLCEGYMRKTVTDTYSGAFISFDSIDISDLSDYGFYCLQWNISAGGSSWTITNSPAIDDFTAGELYADEESIYSDAFDKYANLAALPSNYTTSATDFAYDKEGSGHGNAFSANCGKSDSAWNICYFRPDKPFTMGQYHITFDIRLGTTSGASVSCGGGSNNGSGVTMISTTNLNSLTNKNNWYRVEIIYDAGRARSSFKVLDSSGTQVVAGKQDSFNKDNADAMVSFLGWSANKASSTGSTWDGDSCFAIDNLHIGKYNDYIPTFTINTGSNPATTTVRMTNRGTFNIVDLYVMLAAYDASGNLLGYTTTSSTGVSAGVTNGALSSASLSKPAGAVTYKAFLWRAYTDNGETVYKPMTEAVTAP